MLHLASSSNAKRRSSRKFHHLASYPALSLGIYFSFQTCRGPNAGAPLGWRSVPFFSHFSTLGTAGLALSADPLAFFNAQP